MFLLRLGTTPEATSSPLSESWQTSRGQHKYDDPSHATMCGRR